MKKRRNHYTPEEKVAILRRHLLEQAPVSAPCDKEGLQPTVLYRLAEEFFENGPAASSKCTRRTEIQGSGKLCFQSLQTEADWCILPKAAWPN